MMIENNFDPVNFCLFGNQRGFTFDRFKLPAYYHSP